ncbi:hypothetical protein PTI98_011633 [Pleurotus ostreatus]|nr:hypothetical protein PTI98_011633 [Pleurotus ostreatus]
MKAEKAQRKADKEKEKAQEEKAQEGKEKGLDNNHRSPKPVHQEKSVQGTPDATMGAPASALGSRLAGDRTSARNLKCSYCCTRSKEEVRGAAGECKGEVNPQSTDGAPGGGQHVDVGGPSAFSVWLPTSIVKAQSKEQAEEVDGKKTVMPVDIDQAMAVSRGRPLSGPEEIAEPRKSARTKDQFTTLRTANEAGRDQEKLRMEHDAKVKADDGDVQQDH